MLDDLLNVNGVEREIEVQFTMPMSWEDARISKHCKEDGLEDLPSDPCGFYWLPMGDVYGLKWTNAKEFALIQDFGTYAYIDEYNNPPGCTQGGCDDSHDAQCVPCARLPVPQGGTGYIGRATFTVELDYHRFPFDRQYLKLKLRAPASLPRSAIFFLMHVDISERLKKGEGGHNLWSIEDLYVEEAIVPFVPGVAADDMDLWMCEATVVIVLQRQIWNYFGNYILLEFVFGLIGLCTLFIPADSIDGRLSIGLTLVLAMNVFQVVLVENMPSTGYLTDMHIFTIANTLLLSALCAEAIIVYAATKYDKKQHSLRGFMKALYSDHPAAEIERATVRLQAAVRGLLVRKRLRNIITKEMTKPHRKSVRGLTSKRATVHSTASAVSATSSAIADVHVEGIEVNVQVQPQVAPAADTKSGNQRATVLSVVRSPPAEGGALSSMPMASVGAFGSIRDLNIQREYRRPPAMCARMCISLRRCRRRFFERCAHWIVLYLDAFALFFFPLALALIVGCSFTWNIPQGCKDFKGPTILVPIAPNSSVVPRQI